MQNTASRTGPTPADDGNAAAETGQNAAATAMRR